MRLSERGHNAGNALLRVRGKVRSIPKRDLLAAMNEVIARPGVLSENATIVAEADQSQGIGKMLSLLRMMGE